MTVIPYGIKYVDFPYGLSKKTLRQSLNLPTDKKIIISVGAINNSHKRMSYIVDEFASIRGEFDNYFLILLGEMGEGSKDVICYAEVNLSSEEYLIRSVSAEEVSKYLYAADYFILASLHEGLPRVLPEALSCGLIPIVHDYIVTRETLGEYGIYKDLTKTNQLKDAISEIESRNLAPKVIAEYAKKTFDWVVLKDKYRSMIKKLADA
jgi:glycosyltransferase involved in cell wall biosynthesis